MDDSYLKLIRVDTKIRTTLGWPHWSTTICL